MENKSKSKLAKMCNPQKYHQATKAPRRTSEQKKIGQAASPLHVIIRLVKKIKMGGKLTYFNYEEKKIQKKKTCFKIKHLNKHECDVHTSHGKWVFPN